MATSNKNNSAYEHPLKGSTSILFKKTPVKKTVKNSTTATKGSDKPNVVKKIIDKANEYPSKASVKKPVVKKTPIKEKSWDDYRKGQTPSNAPRVNNSTKTAKDSTKGTTGKGETTKFESGSVMYENNKGTTYKNSDAVSYISKKTGDTTVKTKDKNGKDVTAVMTKDGKFYSNPPVTKSSTPAAKTVSQIWKEKTGKDWSEAKKLGLSDGSASSNMALLKKLNSGSLSNSDMKPSKFKDVGTLETKKLDTPKAELETKRKGGSVTKMQAGGVVDKIRSGMRNMSRKINAPLRKTGKQLAKKMIFETGGMVNSNPKLTASKKATGSVGGVSKAVSKVAVKTIAPKGRVGGTSNAPKKAAPAMKRGGSMKRK